MRFKYKQILRNVIRPIIPVTLKYKGKTISYEALIDSGADTCVFPAEIGELVGIDIKTGKVGDLVGVIGRAEKIYYHTLDIEIGGNTTQIEAGFSYSKNISSFGLLGQNGIFSVYIIKFMHRKGFIDIDPDMKVN